MTLHSALLLGRSKYSGFQPLSHDRLNTLRTKMLLIIDEVSMVGSNMLLEGGEVVQFIINNNEITNVLVHFDNNRVGLKTIQSSQYRSRFPYAVPLTKYEVVFLQGESEDLKSNVYSSH